MAKLKEQSWSDMTKMQKLGAVVFPHLTSLEMQKLMVRLAREGGERPPQPQKIIPDDKRKHVSPLGGVAQPMKGKTR
jgi:hypothetical protein